MIGNRYRGRRAGDRFVPSVGVHDDTFDRIKRRHQAVRRRPGRPRRPDRGGASGRGRRRTRTLRQRQVDTAQPGRRAGPADHRDGDRRRRTRGPALRSRLVALPATADRHRLSVLQPARRPDGAGQRAASGPAGRDAAQAGSGPGRRVAELPGHRAPCTRLPRTPLGRRAATGCRRPGADEPAAAAAGRRTDRSAGHRVRSGGAQAAHRTQPGRSDGAAGHARPGARRVVRDPHHRAGRRPDGDGMTSDVAVREPIRDPDLGRGRAGGLGRIVRSGVGRRRVQTVVMTLTTLLAVTASVLAAGLVVASSAPFQHSFSRQRGAHLAAAFDSAIVTDAQAAATAHASGVTVAAGPYDTVTLQPRTAGRASGVGTPGVPELPVGVDLPSVTIVGRATAGGDLDRLDMVDGRWPTKAGEVIFADGTMPVQVGDRLTFPSAPGSPTLTVVGLARSIGKTAQAWALPSQVTAMRGPGVVSGIQMLYRFAHASTDDDIAADRAAIAAAVPTGGLAGTSSYLTVKQGAERTAATFAPFVIAFGVLGLAMSVLIIGIVVSGAVSSSTRRIGILKSIGFTPAQVARAYVAQALIPSVIGAGL